MYLYVNLFNEEKMNKKSYYLSGQYLEPIIHAFEKYPELSLEKIKGCIGYINSSVHSDENCFLIDIKNLEVSAEKLSFDFDLKESINIKNSIISKSLYRLAASNDWLNSSKYPPNIFILDKEIFDSVRKGTANIRKQSSVTQALEDAKSNNDWQKIIKIFGTIEEVSSNPTYWNNVNDLYDLAYACSKLGEPHNGKEKDKVHLKEVERYRKHSIIFFKRCCELDQKDFRYASALGYRYYLNVMELSKRGGRKDGNVKEEIDNALTWFDKALLLNETSIKDNYRKGKMILEFKIDNMKYGQRKRDRKFYQVIQEVENEGFEAIRQVIENYENSKIDTYKSRYRNEYAKASYCIASYYLKKSDLQIYEYLLTKISGKSFNHTFRKEDLVDISKALKYLDKCFTSELKINIDSEVPIDQIISNYRNFKNSPIDLYYKAGLTYLYMYYVKMLITNDQDKISLYKDRAIRSLEISNRIALEVKNRNLERRNVGFINEKIALYNILTNNYSKACEILINSKDSYMLNTLTISLLLLADQASLNLAEKKMLVATSDKYNKAINISRALLLYIYSISGNTEEFNKLVKMEEGLLDKTNKKYIDCLGVTLE